MKQKKLFEDEIEIINESKKRHKNLVKILNSNILLAK